MEIARQDENERQLHHFRGLQLEEPQVDPALRPHADLAHDLHRDQQHQGHGVNDIDRLEPEFEAGEGHRKHQHHLARRPGIHAARRRIEDAETDAGDGGNGKHQPPTHLRQFAGKRPVFSTREEGAAQAHVFLPSPLADAT